MRRVHFAFSGQANGNTFDTDGNLIGFTFAGTGSLDGEGVVVPEPRTQREGGWGEGRRG